FTAADPRNVPGQSGQRDEALVERPLPVDAPRRGERLGPRPLLDRVLLQPQHRRDDRVSALVLVARQPPALRARRLRRPRQGLLQRELLPPERPRARRRRVLSLATASPAPRASGTLPPTLRRSARHDPSQSALIRRNGPKASVALTMRRRSLIFRLG